ncbi:MAG: class I SAM-dependent methyltransferase family protein [Candidatus Bathyarchaeia archaeon]
MSKETPCFMVPKQDGEKAIIIANKLKIIDKALEIKRNENHIYIPLIRYLSQSELEGVRNTLPTIKISSSTFTERRKRKATYIELLNGKVPPHLFASLPKAIDFVGEIAIIEIPPELGAYGNLIGEAIMQAQKGIRTVLAKTSAVSGTYRLREYTLIAGEPKSETIHKEHGCKYFVDVSKAYFSPRLSHEHYRIASQVREGETVIDMFAGVGPFSILIAKTHNNIKVYAIDINPDAVAYLKRNILLNRVEGKVYPILGDAREIVGQKLTYQSDRVIMNLPEKSVEFIDAACKALKPEGGIIHLYSFIRSSEPLNNFKARFRGKIEEYGRRVEEILNIRFVRETAPYKWQVALDLKIR